MVPVALAVIAFLAGSSGGGILGYIFGKSKAQAEIERLTKMAQEYAELARKSQERVKQLETHIQRLKYELDSIKSQRNMIERFMVFVRGEHPEVIAKYNAISASMAGIEAEQTKVQQREQALHALYAELKAKYPKEMAQLEQHVA